MWEMCMPFDVSRYGNEVNVALAGTLTYNDAQAFRTVFALAEEKALEAIFLDFETLEAIDDAGLGLLMMLHSRAKANLKRIAMCRARGEVETTLTRARFDILFGKN